MGLTAGPVPPRVDGCVKAGLLELIDHAVESGWSIRHGCAQLGLDQLRVARWQHRRGAHRLEDAPPGGHPLHGILDWERAAIVALFEAWGEIDRSHRKLAHRGSRLGLVHVSESTMHRVLAAEGLVLHGNPPREPTPRHPVAGLAGVETEPHLGLRLRAPRGAMDASGGGRPSPPGGRSHRVKLGAA